MSLDPVPTGGGWLAQRFRPLYNWLVTLRLAVNALVGSSWNPVRVITAGALPANTWTLATQTKEANANGALTIDGVAMAAGDRFWDNHDAVGLRRGLFYVVSAGGVGSKYSVKRPTDADASADFADGKTFSVSEGTSADQSWRFTTNAPFVLNTDTPTIARESGVVHVDDSQTITGAKSFATLALRIWNAGATFAHRVQSSATATRIITLPDVDLTPAQAGVASGGASATACAGSTATDGGGALTVDKVNQQANLGALAAPGTNYVGQYAAGAAIADNVGPFTRFVPPRTVQIARGGAGVPTVYQISGTDCSGSPLVETINSNGAATVQGTRAFATMTAVQSDVDPTVTTDVQTGNGFGLGAPFSDLDAVGVNGVLEAPTSSHGASGTVIPASAPNAARVYHVAYRVQPAGTFPNHQHAVGTIAGPAHTHTQT